MHVRNWAGAAAAAAAVVMVGLGVLRAQQQAWPPPVVQDDPSAPAPARPPEDALTAIAGAPGCRVELAAAEPMALAPILAEFDADGRLWVVQMPGFAMDLDMRDSRE